MPALHLKAAVLIVTLLFFSCGKSREPQATSATSYQRYNVVFVSIDTLRADYLKLYSPQGAQTPHLEELAKDSAIFRNVISQIPYTLPSHSSMFSGVYPVAHTVRDNVHGFLPDKILTLAEIFRNKNYQTAGFTGAMILSRRTGIAQGFDYYDDYYSRIDVQAENVTRIERRAEDVFSSFQYWFSKRDRGKQFFAFLHFYDPHAPYDPPSEFRTAGNTNELYKGEIRYVDFVLGKLFAYLREQGAWQNTVVLVTSDHGEMLNEHREIGHGFFLYQSALRVPLILHAPGIPGRKEISDMVQLIDIAPTILDVAGIGFPAKMHGESLVPLLQGKSRKRNRLGFSESYFASIQLGVSPLKSVQEERYKYIESPTPELYDLLNDATESKNLLQEETKVANRLKQMLLQYQKKYENTEVQSAERKVSSEEAEQLAALGYLGGNVPESNWDRGKDPKDFIDEWNQNLEATSLVDEGRYSDALALITKMKTHFEAPVKSKSAIPVPVLLLESKCYRGLGDYKRAETILNPLKDTEEGLTGLAEIYAKTDRHKKADEAYRRSLELHFSYFTLYNYALFLKETGRTQEGLVFMKKARETRPDSEQEQPFWAEIYFVLGELDQAEKRCLAFIAERPWEMKWYILLASVYQSKNDLGTALNILTSNHDRFAGQPEYLLRLGILYNLTKQHAKEIDTFKEMMRLKPNDPRGYFYCAKALLDQKEDLDAAIQLSLRGLQLNPGRDMQIFGYYILGEAYHLVGKENESQNAFKLAKNLETPGQ